MSSPKYRSVEVINNPARPGSNHREVNCINYKQQDNNNNNNKNNNNNSNINSNINSNSNNNINSSSSNNNNNNKNTQYVALLYLRMI